MKCYTNVIFQNEVFQWRKHLAALLRHFYPFDFQRTYKQRHFVNDKFWKTPDGPVFLYIGGEGGLSPFSLLGGNYCK